MLLVEIASIALNHLNEKDKNTVNELFDRFGMDGFVEIIDGDESKPLGINTKVYTPVDIMKMAKEIDNLIIVVSADNPSFPVLESYAQNKELGYWSGKYRLYFGE